MGNVESVIWLHVSVAMVSTAMQTVQEQHAKQDSWCLIAENVEETAGKIRVGSVLITLVAVSQTSLFKMESVKTVLLVAANAQDQVAANVRAVLIKHGRWTQYQILVTTVLTTIWVIKSFVTQLKSFSYQKYSILILMGVI